MREEERTDRPAPTAPDEQTGGWPGPSPAAERKAAEVRENLAESRPVAEPDSALMQDELFEPARAAEFRRRWDAVKASFVDDPRAAVRQAEELADEVVRALTEAVDARRRDLAERGRTASRTDGDQTETERLRVVLHGYRDVLDPVLGR